MTEQEKNRRADGGAEEHAIAADELSPVIVGDEAVGDGEWFLAAGQGPVAPFVVVPAGTEEHARAALGIMRETAAELGELAKGTAERMVIEERSRALRARLVRAPFEPVREAFSVIGVEATLRELPASKHEDREVRIHPEARVSTIRLEVDRAEADGSAHDRVHVWNRGAKAGTLVLKAGDGDGIVELLGQGMCRDRGRAVDALTSSAYVMTTAAELLEGKSATADEIRIMATRLRERSGLCTSAAKRIESLIGGAK